MDAARARSLRDQLAAVGRRLVFTNALITGWRPAHSWLTMTGIIDMADVEWIARIIWATWHIVTVFGWCLGAVLLRLSLPAGSSGSAVFIEQAIVLAALAASALVLFGTRAKHPGWIGLLVMALCTWEGRSI